MIRITHAQARYLAYGPSGDGKVEPQEDLVIEVEALGQDGWLFVHQAGSEEEEGSGVWVDPHGNEHQGPGEPVTLRWKDKVAYNDRDFLAPGNKTFILIEPA